MGNGMAVAIVSLNGSTRTRPDAIEPEFEHSFARLDYVASDQFDVMWHRHTGQWWRLYHSVSLVEAFRQIEQDGHLHPI
jgi:hypothetical protein